MKTTKPLRLSVLVRPYELARKVHAVITLFAPFRLDDPQHLLTDMEMWPAAAKALGEGGPAMDEGLAKVSGEIFVAGFCHPPNPPQAVSYVGVTLVGEDGEPRATKRIAVIGDREWKLGVPTAPEPFSSMPIIWQRAFGGTSFAKNPLGRGVQEKKANGGAHHLPNLEDPGRLVRSPSDAPDPLTFLPYDPTWPQRISKMGSKYDEKWLQERYPGPAEDVDPTCYNAGGEDQRLSGYSLGGERFIIENMHPQKHRIEGHLPRLVGRAFITRRPKDEKMPRRGRPAPTKLEEVRTRIDTVWLFPEEQMGVLIFRGTTPATDDDLADIEHLLIAADDPREPRSLSHFEQTLLSRLDPDTGVIRLLDDEDLLPPERLGWEVSFPEFEVEQHTAPVGYLKANLAAQARKLREDARASVLAMGLDLEEYGLDKIDDLAEPETPSLREPKKLAAFIREHLERAKAEQAKGEARGAEMRAEAEATAAEHGIEMGDHDRVAGPPALRVRAMLKETMGDGSSDRTGERDLTREELRAVFNETAIARLEAKEKEAIEAYRKTAQFEAPPRLPAEELRAARRMQIMMASELYESSSSKDPGPRGPMDGQDFSGVDLSGLDLSGMNLSGIFLERANLTGCNLARANLDRAMIAHADLTDANLDDCSLVDANLGSSTLVRTSLRRAALAHARLDRAVIEDACFEGVTIEQTSFLEMTVRGVDFSGAVGNQTIFLRLDLRGAKFQRARLTKTLFVECKLEDASFDDAEMPKTQLVTCSATGLSARGARLRGSFVGHGSTLDRANLDGVDLSSSSLRTTSLVNASFKSAKLSGADLSECDATGANFNRVQADKSMMQRTLLRGANLFGANLREAILSKANLAECDLSYANLFRADLSRIHVSGGTKIDGALLELARVEPKESSEEKAE